MKKDIVITIAEQHIPETSAIAGKMRTQGVELTGVHDFGVITGTVEESAIPELRRLPGIATLDLDQPVQLPPPGCDVQ